MPISTRYVKHNENGLVERLGCVRVTWAVKKGAKCADMIRCFPPFFYWVLRAHICQENKNDGKEARSEPQELTQVNWPEVAEWKSRIFEKCYQARVARSNSCSPGIRKREGVEKAPGSCFGGPRACWLRSGGLAIRAAEIWWRLGRIPRYEAEVATAAVARVEADLDERSGKPSETSEYREEARKASLIIQTLEALPELSDETTLDAISAVVAVRALWDAVPDPQHGVNVPGIPVDDAESNAFDQWTAGILRKATEMFAAAGRMSPENLLFKCIQSAYKNRERAEESERRLVEKTRRWTLLVERETHSRMLLEPAVLGTVNRYEVNLERSLFRNLHEIQRLKALDADLTVHPEGSS
jgi:hypothetical protein